MTQRQEEERRRGRRCERGEGGRGRGRREEGGRERETRGRGEVRRIRPSRFYDELGLLTLLHGKQTLVPSSNDLPCAHFEFQGCLKEDDE